MVKAYKREQGRQLLESDYESVWRRLCAQDGACGVMARIDGKGVGVAHFLFHSNVWLTRVCYLQDVFTLEAFRRKGVGRALIEAVARMAREEKVARLYWWTQEDNIPGRALYDQIAKHDGLVRYDYPLNAGR